MRRHLLLFLLLAGLLLWSSAGLAATAAGPDLATTWTAAGGDYRLVTTTWVAPVMALPAAPKGFPVQRPQAIAQGGGYTLLSPDTSALVGNGCCCEYLPCLRRAEP